MLIRHLLTIICAIFAVNFPASAQKPADPQRALDSLYRELRQVESELQAGKYQEQDVLERLDARHRQLTLQEGLIRQQKRYNRSLRDSIRILESIIAVQEQQLDGLNLDIRHLEDHRSRIARSLVRTMLRDDRMIRWGSLEFLLGAVTLRDMLNRRSVLLHLQESHKSALRSMKHTADTLYDTEERTLQLTEQHRLRKDELATKQGQAKEAENSLIRAAASLSRGKDALDRQLTEIRSNRLLLEARRTEIERAQETIRQLIVSSTESTEISGIPLSQFRGSLGWPVRGTVIETFGIVRNRELNTEIDNPGIELATSGDEPVVSVGPGRITSVSWLRGFGNVCIIEHPGQIFTVYARLGEVAVRANTTVESGTVLGYAAYDPLSKDHRLHFEVWTGKEKTDPLTWLKKP